MALKIRLQRHGRKSEPVYRVVVAEARGRRDGRFVETLGHYNPQAKGQTVKMSVKLDRVDYWCGVGAKPTDTVRYLIKESRKNLAAEPAVSKA